MRTATLSKNHLLLYTTLYACIGILIHGSVFADHIAIPAASELLITQLALSSPTLLLQVAGHLLAALTLNLLPLFFILSSLWLLAPKLARLGLSTLPIFLAANLGLWVAALAYNKLHFPRSSFGLILPIDSPSVLSSLGLASLMVFLLLGVLPALWVFATYLLRLLTKPRPLAVLCAALLLGLIHPLQSRWTTPASPSQQPDIIILGLDSVAPQHLQHNTGALPLLEKHLGESLVFTETLTPLARTFPAWLSILTAQYPVHHGARFNLTAFDRVETQATLPNILKQHGYVSIYAQDERRFNNINEDFGFDMTVGPTPGAAEFVLTKVADQPLTNLALLHPWGRELFPFVANNRAADIHYEPGDFVASIIDSLPADNSKPLFLAAHFCLAHYPYQWRSREASSAGSRQSLEQRHIEALGSLERQVASLIEALRQHGRLDNAIVVLLSDHGEAMSYADGHWVSTEKYMSHFDRYKQDGYVAFPGESSFSGHGSDTLDRTQHQCLLAFQGYGAQKQLFPAGRDTRLSSLVDVMPTLLGALGMEAPSGIDGVDLLAVDKDPLRTVTSETGIRLDVLASIVDVDEDKLLQESQQYYTVEPDSGRLVLRPERYAELVASKDIAIHTEDWILALLRKNSSPVFPRTALLVHKPSGVWTTGNDTDLIRRAPVSLLTQRLHQLYGHELDDFQALWPFRQ